MVNYTNKLRVLSISFMFHPRVPSISASDDFFGLNLNCQSQNTWQIEGLAFGLY